MTDGSLSGQSARLLLVCHANVARSPLAQVLLTQALPAYGVWLASAGVHARAGDPAAPEAVTIAARRGLDLSSHRSRRVTDDVIRDADLILTMTERQRDLCASRVAGAGTRAFTLRQFVRLLDAAPPAGGPVATPDRLRWLRDEAHHARPRSVRPADPEDIADPTGRDQHAWQALMAELDDLVPRIGAAVDASR